MNASMRPPDCYSAYYNKKLRICALIMYFTLFLLCLLPQSLQEKSTSDESSLVSGLMFAVSEWLYVGCASLLYVSISFLVLVASGNTASTTATACRESEQYNK